MQEHGEIPNQYLFVWDDNFLPYHAYLAIKSAALHCRPDHIYILKTPQLDGVPNFERLRREVDCLRPINIDVPAWLEEAKLPCANELMLAMRFLTERRLHSARSDLLRVLGLYLRGGIYLDTDTLTLRDMTPLRQKGAFVAQELILVDSATWKANSPRRYFRTSPLTLARNICSRFSWGVRCYQWMAPLFVHALHNATMGFPAGHRLLWDILLRIAVNYPGCTERYSLLGPDTIQDLVVEHDYENLSVLPPRHFSPLGPTMTYQYFRNYRPATIDALVARLVQPDTYAIHWGSHGTRASAIPQSDEQVMHLRNSQLFSRIASSAAFGMTPAASA